MRSRITLFALLALGILSCKKENTASKVPVISSLEIFPDSVKSGSAEDTLLVAFLVSDGDGDLGNDAASMKFDIFFKDNWGNNPFPFYFPDIPDELVDKTKGIIARCTVQVPAAQFLVLRPDPIHATGDTVKYEIYVEDRAGNKSNTLTTPEIYIKP
jgi:hypothetical protein